ncbi:hypothetical protein [Motilimonas pumila]|uniref:Uncharacterized protein n=1 Tax=Motilimonas pumila TaxID=2303987 RepID=A0A418YD69_9GAMM|nr:hypothetical protein [Motilimonas pumila]RJG42489.1 hypothetical protein D1Z90_12525 [Motilimonas pumila]
MKKDIKEKIKILSHQIDKAMKFESEDEDEEYFANKSSKDCVLNFILEQHENFKKDRVSRIEFTELFDKCILMLINNTGCSEDFEILESILDKLYSEKLIDEETYSEIVNGSNLGRWLD